MSYSPNLLKNLGIKLAMEFAREKRPAEIRLFQAILLQAFEDSLSMSGFKKETYWKEDSHKWFLENSRDFQDICWNADMDPEMVREEYIKLIDNGKIILQSCRDHGLIIENFINCIEMLKSKEEEKLKEKFIQKN